MLFRFASTFALATVLLASSAQAAPPQAPISPDEWNGAVAYMMPLVLDGVSAACGPQLDPTGYVRTRLPALTASYQTERGRNWSAAKTVFIKISNERDQPFGELSENLQRQLLDEMLSMSLRKEIKPSSCVDIERILASLSPLDSTQLTTLVATIADVASRAQQNHRMNHEGAAK